MLQNLIFRGELLPDEPMREAALSERFEVSRRTVREALSILEHAGLVRHHRHKGTRVARAARGGHPRPLPRAAHARTGGRRRRRGRSASRRDALAEAFRRLSEATSGGRADRIVAQDLEFHRGVVGLLDSARMDQFFATVAVEMMFALTVLEASYQESKRRPKAALAEHREILDALLAADVATARRLIGAHVDVNERLLLDSVGDD